MAVCHMFYCLRLEREPDPPNTYELICSFKPDEQQPYTFTRFLSRMMRIPMNLYGFGGSGFRTGEQMRNHNMSCEHAA